MINLGSLHQKLLKLCQEDHVGLWFALSPVDDFYRVQYAAELRSDTTQNIYNLLKLGLIEAGFPTRNWDGFELWNFSPDEILHRINSKWDQAKEHPDFMEAVYFKATVDSKKKINKDSLLQMSEREKSIVEKCTKQPLDLWGVIDINNTYKSKYAVKIQEKTFQILRDLLEFGLIQAGFPTSDGRKFNPWKTSSEDTISRIISELDALGREPTIGEIVWFTTTLKGDKETAKLRLP
ncbi:MAG: hypothetical protein AAB592_02485 [Patescibacteria group bacterium]